MLLPLHVITAIKEHASVLHVEATKNVNDNVFVFVIVVGDADTTQVMIIRHTKVDYPRITK